MSLEVGRLRNIRNKSRDEDHSGTSYYAGSDNGSEGSDHILTINDDDDDEDDWDTEVVETKSSTTLVHPFTYDNSSVTDDDLFPDPNQGRSNILFRRVKDNRLVLVEERFPIVDMQVEKEIEERMINDEKLNDDYRHNKVVTFVWNDINASAPATLTTLRFEILHVEEGFYSILYSGMVRDDFLYCRQFVSKIYRNFRSKIVNIVPGSLSFEVLHDNDLFISNMLEDKESNRLIVSIFKELVLGCTHMTVEVRLQMETSDGVTAWKELMEDETKNSLQRLESRARQQGRYISKVVSGTVKLNPGASLSNDFNSEHIITLEELEAEQVEMNRYLDSIISSLPSVTEEGVTSGSAEVQDKLPAEARGDHQGRAKPVKSKSQSSMYKIQTDPKMFYSQGEQLSLRNTEQSNSLEQKRQRTMASTPPTQEPIPRQVTTHSQSSTRDVQRHPPITTDQPVLSIPSFPFGMDESWHTGEGSSDEIVTHMMKMIEATGGSDETRIQRLPEALKRNLADEDPVPPRADAHDTILCLDSSQSMEGQAFEDMKRIAYNFVDGIEEIALKYGLEANIAVVVLSDYANVKQQLTNDYSRVRNIIDNLVPKGRTPFFEALIVCLAALTNCKGRIINVAGVHFIRPRILFITDGRPTDESQIHGPDTESGRMTHKMPIIKLVTDLGSKDAKGFAEPVVWIPVGKADRDFLKSLASLGNGILADEKDIPELCRYYRIQDGIGRVYSCVHHERKQYEGLPSSIEAVTDGLVPDLSPEDKRHVVEAVTDKLKTKKTENKPYDFDDIHEDPSFPPLGSRVVRGPDWKWKDQDSGGAGTIISHNTLDKWIWVKWDNGEQNAYRYGEQGAYDILTVDDHPRTPESGDIPIGVRVTRGPDWRYGDDDGGQGCSGVVIRKKGKTLVKVRWDNDSIKPYKYGSDGIYELTVCDPSVRPQKQPVPDYLLEPKVPKSENTGTLRLPSDEKLVWQWQDEQHQWRLYPDEIQIKLNEERNRTCLVNRKGNTFRVVISQMIERAIEGNTRHSIRQTGMSDEDVRTARLHEGYISV